MSKGWYGCDLDGTIAYYDEFIDATHIGKPIPLMVYRIKQHIDKGNIVKIFTARAAMPGFHAPDLHPAKKAIQDWCLEHLGLVLPITNAKDFEMIGLYDDRAIQIEPNTGMRMDGEKDYDCACCDDSIETNKVFGPMDPTDCTCPEWCPNG